ncbi:Rv3235 family protein [Streptomyces sp. NBC_00454]|uniref:Rv3235 family protein n=1 Tax=Streptomyces sp. NBC_00454 TaxID=2975747 RepID=UPI0030E3DDD1
MSSRITRTGRNAVRPPGRHDQRRPPATIHRGPHHWFADRLLAVLSGLRPVHSLMGHTVGPAYDQLITLASPAAADPADPTDLSATTTATTAAAGPLQGRLRPVIRQCGRFTPGPGVIEAFARIATGDRLTAMAFRLEQGPDLRWRCAAVELRGPRP